MPNDGSVTVPVITTVRVYGATPIRTVSPTFLPSAARVTGPSSIWSPPDRAFPAVVGGWTEPRSRRSPSAGTTRPSTGSWVNENSDQAATACWPASSLLITPGVKLP